MTRHSAAPLARRFAVVLALGMGLVMAAPAFAGGGSANDLEVGVFLGMVSPDSFEPLNPDGGSFYGFRIGFNITDA